MVNSLHPPLLLFEANTVTYLPPRTQTHIPICIKSISTPMASVTKAGSKQQQKQSINKQTKKLKSWATSVSQLLSKLRQEEPKHEASLHYIARPCLKIQRELRARMELSGGVLV